MNESTMPPAPAGPDAVNVRTGPWARTALAARRGEPWPADLIRLAADRGAYCTAPGAATEPCYNEDAATEPCYNEDDHPTGRGCRSLDVAVDTDCQPCWSRHATAARWAVEAGVRAWANGYKPSMAAVELLIRTGLLHRIGTCLRPAPAESGDRFTHYVDWSDYDTLGYLSGGEHTVIMLSRSMMLGELSDYWRMGPAFRAAFTESLAIAADA